MNPAYGATRTAPCPWCKRPCVQTFRRYPPVHALPGGFWDVSECTCARIVRPDGPQGVPVLAGLIKFGAKVVDDLNKRHQEEDSP